ncbi:hypothetical protein F5B19DRAFT_469184 [Rostrohypoxylon terebratum]|nr:hypothetical protein F5B19DRAFT_469184 [Rostrohypoxylon terebratum]
MLFFLAIAAVIIWTVVVALALLINVRLFLKTIRWALTLFMVVLGVPLIIVLHAGLAALQLDKEQADDATFMWMIWYIFAAASILFWPFLIPAVIGMASALKQPWVLKVLDYGLVRLSWSQYVYNPLWHMTLGGLKLWITIGAILQQIHDEQARQEGSNPM